MPGKEINFNFNLTNNYQIGKKGKADKAETTQKTTETVPIVKPAEANTVDETDLNMSMNNLLGVYISQKGKVDTSEQATFARVNKAFIEEPESYRIKQEAGVPADVPGLDEDLAAFLPAKALAFTAKMTPEIQERIAAGAVNEFDRMVALA